MMDIDETLRELFDYYVDIIADFVTIWVFNDIISHYLDVAVELDRRTSEQSLLFFEANVYTALKYDILTAWYESVYVCVCSCVELYVCWVDGVCKCANCLYSKWLACRNAKNVRCGKQCNMVAINTVYTQLKATKTIWKTKTPKIHSNSAGIIEHSSQSILNSYTDKNANGGNQLKHTPIV